MTGLQGEFTHTYGYDYMHCHSSIPGKTEHSGGHLPELSIVLENNAQLLALLLRHVLPLVRPVAPRTIPLGLAPRVANAHKMELLAGEDAFADLDLNTSRNTKVNAGNEI